MSVKRHLSRFLKFALLATLALSTAAWAQDQPNHRFEIFGGYSFLHPGGTIAQTPVEGSPENAPTINLKDMNHGFGLDGTYKFNRWLGAKVAFNGHYSDPSNVHTVMFGPVLTIPIDNLSLFAEGLGGISIMTPSNLNLARGPVGAVGGGMDLWLSKRLAWRVFQADYIRQSQKTTDVGQSGDFSGARVQTGIVFGFGSLTAPLVPAAACTVTPNEVIVGETVTANVSATNFNPKHTLAYQWSGAGVSSTSNAATIATKDLTPGVQTVTAKVTDPKKAKDVATCSAQFTVKPLPPKNPPVASCTASPSTIIVGGAVNVNCTCTSPDGVAVKVANWTASAGSISGAENTASVNTTGVAPGNVTVGATCTDARGLATQATAAFAVEPVPAPKVDKKLEARLALHSVYFQTAKPTVKEPTVGLLKTQEKTLDTLASDFATYRQAVPDAHLVLEGHADVRGSAEYNQALTERRVEIVKNYLIAHGVSESLIETKPLGAAHNLTADEVKASVDSDTELSKEDKARILKNIKVITLASNRRVDVTLKAAGMSETSKREFPFNSADALTLLAPNAPAKKAGAVHKKAAPKQ